MSMEKKQWSYPSIKLVQFAAGDYCVSSCVSPEGYKIYNFVCDAGTQFGSHNGLGWAGLLWYDTNGLDGLQWDSTTDEAGNTFYADSYIRYQGCKETTQTTEANTFFKGWFMPFGKNEDGSLNSNFADETQTVDVMIWHPTWVDENGATQSEWHATNELVINNMGAKS